MKTAQFSLLTAVVVLTACGSGTEQRTITLDIDGAAGRTVYFDKYVNNLPTHVDSAVLDGSGKGTFSLPVMPLDFYRIAFNDQEQVILTLDSLDEMSFSAKAGDLLGSAKVEGSKAATSLMDFLQEADRIDNARNALRSTLQNEPGNTSALDEFNALSRKMEDLVRRSIADHPGLPVQYFAVTRLDVQKDLASYQKVRDDLRGPMASSAIYTAFRDNVDRAEKEIAAMKAQEERMAAMDNLLAIGAEAPDIEQQTPEGKTFSLAQLRGKYVLIDFWASWCKPCRIENPNVKKVYAKYNKKGFEILGVSLDRSQDAWIAAIQQDGLPWKHVSDLAFWNNAAAQQYGVNSIPYTVLVDPEGRILAKGLRGAGLESKLEEIFGS